MSEIERLTFGSRALHSGRTLRRLHVEHARYAWAAGSVLRQDASASWSVHIDNAVCDHGLMYVGICAELGCEGNSNNHSNNHSNNNDLRSDATPGWHAWGVLLYSGTLYTCGRGADGAMQPGAPPPAGWPDGRGGQCLFDSAGRPMNLNGKATGATITVSYDARRGTLAFGVDDVDSEHLEPWRPGISMPSRPAAEGFPRGAVLRPWAFLRTMGDAVTLSAVVDYADEPRPLPATPMEMT